MKWNNPEQKRKQDVFFPILMISHDYLKIQTQSIVFNELERTHNYHSSHVKWFLQLLIEAEIFTIKGRAIT